MTASPDNEVSASPSADAENELGFDLAKPVEVSRTRLLLGGLATIVLLCGAFGFTYAPKRAARAELEQTTNARVQALPRVAVIAPELLSGKQALTLPGSIQPLEEAVIYARASGYVRRWLVDIGTHVTENQLLAEIDTPEIEQELAQARAALAQAQANVAQAEANQGLAASRLDRTGKLVEAGVSPQQDLDQTQAQSAVGEADVKVAQANVAAQQANIRRLSELKAYSRVTAPFAGTITERSVDRGSLVSGGNVATPLFRLASTDTVRVFLQVPQDAAPSIVLDAPAELKIREFPNQKFEGHVARSAGALDSATRTLSTEVRVANPDGKLLAGMYAEVSLKLPRARRVFELPATVLSNDANGLRIGVVTEDNQVRYQRVTIERDLGATIQVASGLDGSERVIQVASADLGEGQRVEPYVKKEAAPAPAPSAK